MNGRIAKDVSFKNTLRVGGTPYDVYLMSDVLQVQGQLTQTYKKKAAKIKVQRRELDVGAYVRLQYSDPTLKTFKKTNEASFTKEVFRVTGINRHHLPPTLYIRSRQWDRY